MSQYIKIRKRDMGIKININFKNSQIFKFIKLIYLMPIIFNVEREEKDWDYRRRTCWAYSNKIFPLIWVITRSILKILRLRRNLEP
jgi:hypothetical protein